MSTPIKIKDYYESLSKEDKSLFRGLIAKSFGDIIKHDTFFSWLARNKVPLHASQKVRDIISNPVYGLPQLEEVVS